MKTLEVWLLICKKKKKNYLEKIKFPSNWRTNINDIISSDTWEQFVLKTQHKMRKIYFLMADLQIQNKWIFLWGGGGGGMIFLRDSRQEL